MSAMGVRRGKAALSSGCKAHSANAPAGSNRSSHGGDEMAEAFGMRVTNAVSGRGFLILALESQQLTKAPTGLPS